MTDADRDPFVDHRNLLFTVAYEMLGSAADAEDVVQETWLRWSTVDRAEVREPRAYLVRIVTRQALNRLRSLSRRREDYVGEWLPEPLLTAPDVAEDVELADSVSMAMLTVLETLGPTERAVFVLREVFELPYDEIGAALQKSSAAVRQIATRARNHVAARRPRVDVDRREQHAVVERFLAAVRTGDLQGLMDALAPDVVLRADGGMRTGRDIVIAAMMGAEEFGIGTASLVAMGCIMVRQCHSNTCPVGVCTQDEALRAKFTGTPDKVINLFTFIAEEVREILAGLGFKSLQEIVGRTDLLAQVSRGGEHLDDLDLNPLLVRADPGANKPYCTVEGRNAVPDTLDAQIVRDAAPLLERGEKMQLTYTVRSTARTIGTRTSSHIVRKFGMKGLPSGHLTVQLKGSAGQSLGAFAVQGLRIELTGEANDYVGKGLSGATIVIKPARGLAAPETNTLIGNTVLFGATSGRLFAAGQAGERFAVRNSGAVTVVEGCGANGCEYMTGGQVVILGPTGNNFGAGMTGGMAFVLDQHDRFQDNINPDSIVVQRLASPYWEGVLRSLIAEHARETDSVFAATLLRDWDRVRDQFWQVCPKEMVNRLPQPLAAEEAVHERA